MTVPGGDEASAQELEALSRYASRAASEWRLTKDKGHADAAWRKSWSKISKAIESGRRAHTHGAEWKWLLENARLLRTAAVETRGAGKSVREHPHVIGPSGAVLPRAYAVASEYLDASGFLFDERRLAVYLAAVQKTQELEMGEIWAVKPMLQVALLERIADAASRLMEGGDETGLPRFLTSLRRVGEAEWKLLFEQVNVVDGVLAQDPAGAYARMDYESRDMYRNAVAELASHSQASEREVAMRCVELAQQARQARHPDARVRERRSHVGFYLIDRGAGALRARIGYRAPFAHKIQTLVRKYPNGFYLSGIEIATFVIVAFLLSGLGAWTPIAAAMLLLILPATQAAVDLMNAATVFLLRPRRLPKLDFSDGIPDEFATMVAVPTLLLNQVQVRGLVDDLEIRFLANRDRNLYFALLTDGPDSTQPFDDKDELVIFARDLIEELNAKYGSDDYQPFFLFHRHRVFNASENVWMGWERKRGKLLDLNKLLRNDYDSFPVKVGDTSVLPRIKFVITLDSDTQLPRDSAHRMAGTLAHPLNRAVIDPATNIVVDGYGILQPRVGVSVQSAARSRFASIYAGQTGFDIYTRAVSDVYQDLYGEGSFTGKGIYEVDVLRAVLENRFPLNALLSHDLIEGAYARAGLVSDIEVIDDYPSHVSAYSRRKHRWVRGDWQIVQWLLPRVPDYFNRLVPNPTSVISRWKIFDNLRRSIIEPATFVLLLAGWFWLPGGPLYWTLATLTLLFIPTFAQLGFAFLRVGGVRDFGAFLRDSVIAFAKNMVNATLWIVFLAHQTLLSLDAIVRTLVRSKITRRKLLEWETAAQAEKGGGRKTVDLYLDLTPLISVVIAAALALWRPASLPVALPVLGLWGVSKLISKWLNRPPRSERQALSRDDERFLRLSALRTWRYFRQFSNAQTNWLAPDNVQESPAAIANRISPTNLGFLLNARQAALAMGYITVPEFARDTALTLASAARLPRFEGHFYNWYDTQTFEPLEPRFVSTVDSGNLAGSLWALKQGCLAALNEPMFPPALWQGFRDHASAAVEEGCGTDLKSRVDRLGDNPASWMHAMEELRSLAKAGAGWWAAEFANRLDRLRETLENLAPWALPEFSCPADEFQRLFSTTTAANLSERNAALAAKLAPSAQRDRLERAAANARSLAAQLLDIAAEAERLVDEMDFSLVYNRRKKLLSVGYDTDLQRMAPSCYDLLASEARMAAFVAVAKGDIPQESWFHLGRTHTLYKGRRVLISWTGTMFEYLMPPLWMRPYQRTILERSMRAVVEVQRRYAKSRRIPWGISEAAYSVTDEAGNYQYRAFGIPKLGLKQETPALVVSPYSSFLALQVDAAAAVANLNEMRKRGWLGVYGFYESADFREGCELVRCWMAHHQGMSLLAVCNLLASAPFQRYFHAEPRVIGHELLLQEKAPRRMPVEAAGEEEEAEQLTVADAVAATKG